jgi:sigma-B regulation protein RsbU (phosphoserine phosphatase)
VYRQAPDLLILDWVMPEMDGLEVCRRLRGDRRFDGLYIIILTVTKDPADKVQALDDGADDYLTKPLTREELLARLRSARRILSLNHHLSTALGRLRRDVAAASAVQRDLLPQRPIRHDPLFFTWEFRPAEDMAGDMFDIFKADEDHVVFYMFDVSGHGVSSAMLSISLRNAISLGPLDASVIKHRLKDRPFYQLAAPDEVMRRLNQRFQMTHNGLYFTMFYGLVNLRTLRLRFARCGTNPPLIIRDGRAIRLEQGDVPAGLFPDTTFSTHDFDLAPGDRLYLCSDAATEARNDNDEFYHIERVERGLLNSGSLTLPEAVEALVRGVEEWQGAAQFQDDLSVLAMEVSRDAKENSPC